MKDPDSPDSPLDDNVAQFITGSKRLREVWPDRFNVHPLSPLPPPRGRWGVRNLKWWWARLPRVVLRMMQTPAIAGDMARALSHGDLEQAQRMAITAAQASVHPQHVIISRKYGFLWLSTPKVASRSIVAALMGVDPDAEIIGNKNCLKVLARYPEVKSYYSFAFVRHPFGRALSFYAQLQRRYESDEGKIPRMMEQFHRSIVSRFFGLAEVSEFDGYCRWLNTPYGSDALADHHFGSQHLIIRAGRNRLPDFVGRIENIEADLDRVAAHLNMPKLTPPLLNTAVGWTATPGAWQAARSKLAAQLNEENKALLAKRYADDFKLFGYSPKTYPSPP